MSKQPVFQSLLSRLLLGTGAVLITTGLVFAWREYTPGEVVLKAEGFDHVVLVKDVAESREIVIFNNTRRRITLHGAQGWS